MRVTTKDNSDLSKPIKQIKKRKRLARVSAKQAAYEKWLINVARPYVINRDGDICRCCLRVHYPHDLDHIIGKGTRPDLKKNLDNLQILGRFPCHRLKTDNKDCKH